MKYYITTAIAYTNAKPHLGHALEFIQTDVLARYHRMIGNDVRFLTGTDEHGSKIERAAKAAGKGTLEFVDEVSDKFVQLDKLLNISNDDFIRTTDRKRHWPVVEKIWRTMAEKGDLYKKEYEGLYCVGHEAFIKKSELIDGICPDHKTEPEKIKEENWFFKLSKYKKEVSDLIENDKLRIVPESRKNEILNLIDEAEDISFSRPRSTLTWGIPVPDDDTQTIYVWADALVNYISALGYGTENWKLENENSLARFWPADVHLIGKDILRFHALYWPAMLLSAGLSLPSEIYVHGFVTVEGEKMSKTIGNVVDPFDVVKKYGVDVVRYFLLREIPSDEDGDFSYKKLEDRYNGELANGLGNLIQRVATLIENNLNGELDLKDLQIDDYESIGGAYGKAMATFRLHEALGEIWWMIGNANKYIDEQKPWSQVKDNPDRFLKTMATLVYMIHEITFYLEPFMPETAQKIQKIIGDENKGKDIVKEKFKITKGEGLFPRLK